MAIIGGLLGVFIGAAFGMATFGMIGAMVGMFIGGSFGYFFTAFFVAGEAMQAATRVQTVTCPVSREAVKVQIDPIQSAWAAITPARPRVVHCGRWKGTPECDRRCEETQTPLAFIRPPEAGADIKPQRRGF